MTTAEKERWLAYWESELGFASKASDQRFAELYGVEPHRVPSMRQKAKDQATARIQELKEHQAE